MKPRHHGPRLRFCLALLLGSAVSAHAQHVDTDAQLKPLALDSHFGHLPPHLPPRSVVSHQPYQSQRTDELPPWTEAVQTTFDIADFGRKVSHIGEAGVATDSSAAVAARTINVSESGFAYASASRHMPGLARGVAVPRVSSGLGGLRRVGGFLLALLGVGAASRNREGWED